MSIGAPSNLGTVLIQRLDAVLGTTLSQQANLVAGTGPQAVPQPGNPENTSALQNPSQRHPRESVDQAGERGKRQATVGKAQREIQLDNLLGRRATFQATTQSAPTTLGYAARIILALLNEYPHSNQSIRAQAPLLTQSGGTQAGITSGTPAGASASAGAQAANTTQLWAQLATALNQPGALAARFAQALSQSIQNSGLFYESHLAKLAAGKTSPHALRQEPQGQIISKQAVLPGQTTLAQPPTASSSLVQGTATQNTASTQASSTTTSTGLQNNPVPGIDPQAQTIVRQQLEVLANQGFIWQGEAWPGAAMKWDVHRHQAGDQESTDFEDEHWSTRLNLQLPTLGQVQARLSISGDQLVMRLTATQSAERLSGAIESLRERLLAQGLQASQLSVTARDTDASASTHADETTTS